MEKHTGRKPAARRCRFTHVSLEIVSPGDCEASSLYARSISAISSLVTAQHHTRGQIADSRVARRGANLQVPR